jgi:hypothetical protein
MQLYFDPFYPHLLKEIQMNTPKMLPWLANTAGMKLGRAEQLWNSATDSAQHVTGESTSARYLSIAHDQFVIMVEKEILASNPVADTPWLMIQANISLMPMIVFNGISHALKTVQRTLCRSIGTPAKCS